MLGANGLVKKMQISAPLNKTGRGKKPRTLQAIVPPWLHQYMIQEIIFSSESLDCQYRPFLDGGISSVRVSYANWLILT